MESKFSLAECLASTIFSSGILIVADQRSIRTNNPLERIMKEIQRRTNVVGAFPDGNSALMLVAARLRHIAGTRWSRKRYLNIELIKELEIEEVAVA